MSYCFCDNPRCPGKNPACEHCYCIGIPDFEPGQNISWGGPMYKVCCKCRDKIQINSVTSYS